MRHVHIIISTFFYSGFSPFAPGTAGTLAFLPFYWLFFSKLGWYYYVPALIVIYFAGVWSSNYAAVIFKEKDPGKVVIDEVAGYMITMLFIPFTLKRMIVGFFIARILDIIKPYPARQLEGLRGGNGIMADDAMSGIYGNILMWVLIWFKII